MLITPYDHENMNVNESHEEERGKEEWGKDPTKSDQFEESPIITFFTQEAHAGPTWEIDKNEENGTDPSVQDHDPGCPSRHGCGVVEWANDSYPVIDSQC